MPARNDKNDLFRIRKTQSVIFVPDDIVEHWKDIGTEAVGLYIYLCYQSNKNNIVEETDLAEISQFTGMDVDDIATALEKLKQLGFVDVDYEVGDEH